MKLPATVLSLALALCSSVAAEEFTTSRGLRSLPPIATLSSEAELSQAARAGEAALSELLLDAVALDQEGSALTKEAAALEQRLKDELAALRQRKAQFEVTNKQYLDALAAYKEKQAAFQADLRDLNDQNAAINSLPPEEREANVTRVKQWAAESEAQRTSLDAERDALLEQHKTVEAERAAVRNLQNDAGAKLRAVHDALLARIEARRGKRELVYTQLRQCAAYVANARNTRRAKFGHAAAPSPVLDGALQRLKLYQSGVSKQH